MLISHLQWSFLLALVWKSNQTQTSFTVFVLTLWHLLLTFVYLLWPQLWCSTGWSGRLRRPWLLGWRVSRFTLPSAPTCPPRAGPCFIQVSSSYTKAWQPSLSRDYVLCSGVFALGEQSTETKQPCDWAFCVKHMTVSAVHELQSCGSGFCCFISLCF